MGCLLPPIDAAMGPIQNASGDFLPVSTRPAFLRGFSGFRPFRGPVACPAGPCRMVMGL